MLSANPMTSVLWPMRLPGGELHRVDGADTRGLGRQLVEQRDDGLLVGIGDVEAGVPGRFRGGELRRKIRLVLPRAAKSSSV